jgi:hypothetical protein
MKEERFASASESCMHARESMGEAPAGDRIGQPSSRDRHIPEADAVDRVEGNTDACDTAST